MSKAWSLHHPPPPKKEQWWVDTFQDYFISFAPGYYKVGITFFSWLRKQRLTKLNTAGPASFY
jgi:hypothetical protein